MSRSDAGAAAEPRLPRAERTVHRRSAPVPVPVRVVSQRLTTAQAWVPAPCPAEHPAPAYPAPTTGAVTALQQAPPPEIVVLRAAAGRSLPAMDRRTRRRPFVRLMALLRGQRPPQAGRHRPDTIASRGWSMFAPQRRSRRRFGVRR